MSAQTMTVNLKRQDNSSWGFRLQGGKDFSTPLSIQKVSDIRIDDFYFKQQRLEFTSLLFFFRNCYNCI